MYNELKIARQIPAGTLSLFQAFKGIPYTLHIWEKFIEETLEVGGYGQTTMEQEALIVAYDFTKIEGETWQVENTSGEIGV